MTYSAQNPIRRSAAPLLLLAVAILLGACSQTAPVPATPTAPIAAASGPGSIVIGNGVTLDAGGSSGEDLAFSWSLLSRPAGSGATLAGAGSAAPSFTPDLTGTYVLEVEVSNAGGSDSAVTTVQVEYPDISGSWNAVLTPDGSPSGMYTMTLVQSGATLTGTLSTGGPTLPFGGQLSPDGSSLQLYIAGYTFDLALNGTFTGMSGSFSDGGAPPSGGSFSATKM